MTAQTQLDTLEAKGLVRLATLRPELEYLFRHVLVQDAAYGSLLKQERRDLHGRVAQALEDLYPERHAELAPVLALHFEQAGETDRAIDCLIDAGAQAFHGNAIQEAYAAFDRAASLLDAVAPASGRDGEAEVRDRHRRVEAELGRAQTGYSFREPRELVASLEKIAPQADAVGDLDLVARINSLIALVRLQNGDSPDDPDVKRALDRVTEVGNLIGDPSIRAMPLAVVGLSRVFGGPVREGVAALEEAVPLLVERDSIGASFARGALAIGYATLGEWDKAEAAAKNANEIAARGDLISQLDALIAESMVRSARGQLDRAIPLARECIDRANETGASACLVASSWVLGDAYHRLGKFEEAGEVLKVGSDISAVVDRVVWRPTLQAWLDSTLVAMGNPTDGEWDEALATARSINNHLGEAGILAKRGEAEARRGDVDAATADFAAAAAILEGEGARPNLARLLAGWGETLRAAGRLDEATPILRRSLALFEELDLDAEAAGVRTVLALGGTQIAFGDERG